MSPPIVKIVTKSCFVAKFSFNFNIFPQIFQILFLGLPVQKDRIDWSRHTSPGMFAIPGDTEGWLQSES